MAGKSMFINSFTLIITVLACQTPALPSPLQSPKNLSVFSDPNTDQQCGMVSCRNPYHGGAAFCRNLNQGCVFCGPNPRSKPPFVTFACVGHWQHLFDGDIIRAANVSLNASATMEIVDIDEE